jgi:hypothetical protein
VDRCDLAVHVYAAILIPFAAAIDSKYTADGTQ